MSKEQIEQGSVPADRKFRIRVDAQGPYLVFGRPPLSQQFIVPDGDGASWNFQPGRNFPMKEEPTALCRCGHSKDKPYCDGEHLHAEWNPELTASEHPLLEDAEVFEGPTLSLSDNESYCAFARFCDARGRVWNLVGESDDPAAREATVWEANHCTGARLSAWDNQTQQPFEPRYEPSLGLIEDPAIRCSAALWVRGGIRIERPDGYVYEIRNRVALCRCGASSNKPYCDGTHASVKFRDGLGGEPSGEKY